MTEEVSPLEGQNDRLLDVLNDIIQPADAGPADLHGLRVHKVGRNAQLILCQLKPTVHTRNVTVSQTIHQCTQLTLCQLSPTVHTRNVTVSQTIHQCTQLTLCQLSPTVHTRNVTVSQTIQQKMCTTHTVSRHP